MSFRWQECGEPPVERPTRKGFGSTLLEPAIDSSARPAEFNYAPEGLTYDLDVPLASICAKAWLEAGGDRRGEAVSGFWAGAPKETPSRPRDMGPYSHIIEKRTEQESADGK